MLSLGCSATCLGGWVAGAIACLVWVVMLLLYVAVYGYACCFGCARSGSVWVLFGCGLVWFCLLWCLFSSCWWFMCIGVNSVDYLLLNVVCVIDYC